MKTMPSCACLFALALTRAALPAVAEAQAVTCPDQGPGRWLYFRVTGYDGGQLTANDQIPPMFLFQRADRPLTRATTAGECFALRVVPGDSAVSIQVSYYDLYRDHARQLHLDPSTLEGHARDRPMVISLIFVPDKLAALERDGPRKGRMRLRAPPDPASRRIYERALAEAYLRALPRHQLNVLESQRARFSSDEEHAAYLRSTLAPLLPEDSGASQRLRVWMRAELRD